MIFVDTNIWIKYFAGDKKIITNLNLLLDQNTVGLTIITKIEILNGAKKEKYKTLARVFSALPLFYPSQEHWQWSLESIVLAKESGFQFSIPDLLIGSICKLQEGTLWTDDKAFQQMHKLKLINLYSPIQ